MNQILVIILGLGLFVSCKKEAVQPINCTTLALGIRDGNNPVIKPVIDNLTSDLVAKPSASDKIGQKENFTTLVNRLNSRCSNLSATTGCYACLYSGPPQSIINFSVDSSGVNVSRSISIFTPSTGTLGSAGLK